MLSDQNRPVIEATLPVVGEHIGKIAERFYGHMFTEHPELLDGTFNRGNQASGEQQQALAGSVAAFASSLIETPERVPQNLLSRIAHKHASLGIRPDQYQVVHDNLMWAIVDVLGDAVTAEVAAAWDEVYWLMANALINQERGLYSARGVRPETVWRDWQVERKIQETADVVTFVVKRIDDRLVKTSLPGQYVTVRMRMSDGVRQPRQYSLTRADDGEHRQFTVKRVHGGGQPDGEVSTLLHDAVERGDILTMSVPYGEVVLDDAGRPAVFASAGMGIAPMAGMLSHLVTAGSDLSIILLHADVHERTFALRRQVVSDILALRNASIHLWYEEGAQTTNRSTDATGDDGSRPGRPARRRHLLSVRAVAVHAGRAQRTDRARCRPQRHPVRGVRPGPLAGRLRLSAGRCGERSRGDQAAELIRFAMADLRLAAWFLWITPLLAALSRARDAARCSSVASSVLPASTASRNFRTAVRTAERTDLLRWRRFSLVLTRLIWDLMLATRLPRSLSCHRYRDAPAAGMVRARRGARLSIVQGHLAGLHRHPG